MYNMCDIHFEHSICTCMKIILPGPGTHIDIQLHAFKRSLCKKLFIISYSLKGPPFYNW